jgi:hypothetical protein
MGLIHNYNIARRYRSGLSIALDVKIRRPVAVFGYPIGIGRCSWAHGGGGTLEGSPGMGLCACKESLHLVSFEAYRRRSGRYSLQGCRRLEAFDYHAYDTRSNAGSRCGDDHLVQSAVAVSGNETFDMFS